MFERLLAGFIIGIMALMVVAGGVYSVIQGDTESGFALLAIGAPIGSALLAFFVGEANGKKKTS